MERRIAVRGIIVHEGKMLAARLFSKDGGTEDYWCTFGGGVYEGEALIPAMKREMIEETGITPVIGNLLYVQQAAFSGKEHLEFFFHITNAEDYMDIDLSKTTHGLKEIAELAFVDVKAVKVLPDFLAEQDLMALNPEQPTKFFSYL